MCTIGSLADVAEPEVKDKKTCKHRTLLCARCVRNFAPPKKEDTGTFLVPFCFLYLYGHGGRGSGSGGSGSGGRRTYGAEGNIMASAAGAGVPDF